MATVRKHRGRWVADYRDQNRRRHIERPLGSFATRALERLAAIELLQRRLSESDAQAFTPEPKRLTFAEVSARWLRSKVRIREVTSSDYRIMLDCYLMPYFGHREIGSISRFDIEQFRAEMSAGVPDAVRVARRAKLRRLQHTSSNTRLRPLKPGARTTNKCLSVLVSIFGYGKGHALISRNPAEGVEKLRMSSHRSRVVQQNVLMPDELRSLVAHATDPYRIPILLAVYCGLREAEVLGLQWDDIDWHRATAEIRRTYHRGVFDQPKTVSSRRTVELPTELLAELDRWRFRCPSNDHDLVCPAIGGKPMHGSVLLQRGLYPALRRAGIRRIRFHDLRHSFASNLLATGVDIATVSKALGHANAHITLTTYAHAVPKARQGASDRMAAIVSSGGNELVKSETALARDAQVAAAVMTIRHRRHVPMVETRIYATI